MEIGLQNSIDTKNKQLEELKSIVFISILRLRQVLKYWYISWQNRACIGCLRCLRWDESLLAHTWDFINEVGSDNLKEAIEANYKCVKQDVLSLVDTEIERIKNNPQIVFLLKEE